MLDPVSWLMGGGITLVNLFNGWLARRANNQIEERRQRVQQELAELTHSRQEAMQNVSMRRQRELQLELAAIQRESQRLLACEQLQNSLKGIQEAKAIEKWPLRMLPDEILGVYRRIYGEAERAPLTVIVSPPKVQYDRVAGTGQTLPDIEAGLSAHLTSFLTRRYSMIENERPVRFLGGLVETKTFGRQALLEVLFHRLQSIPLLLIESEIEGPRLRFWVGGWGLGRASIFYQEAGSVPYRSVAQRFARARTRQLRELRDCLQGQGRSPEEIGRLLGDTQNVGILEAEEVIGRSDECVDQLSDRLLPCYLDYEVLHRSVAQVHSLIVAGFADLHHLVHYGVEPLLPWLLPELKEGLVPEMSEILTGPEGLLGQFAASYEAAYAALGESREAFAPEFALAESDLLQGLGEPQRARRKIEVSAAAWLESRGRRPDPGRTAVDEVLATAEIMDRDYVRALAGCLARLGEQPRAEKARELLTCWARKKLEGEILYDEIGPVIP